MVRQNNLVVSRLEQDPPARVDIKVADFIREGAGDLAEKLQRFYHLADHFSDATEAEQREFGTLQAELDTRQGWQLESRIEELCLQFEMDPNTTLASLSGGWLRKAALAKALVSQPNVLLLDEPTNHLDVAAIQWLEQFFMNFKGAIIFISHDRAFIRLWPAVLSIWTGVNSPHILVITPSIWNGSKRCWKPSSSTMRCLIKNWRKKRSGSVRALRPCRTRNEGQVQP